MKKIMVMIIALVTLSVSVVSADAKADKQAKKWAQENIEALNKNLDYVHKMQKLNADLDNRQESLERIFAKYPEERAKYEIIQNMMPILNEAESVITKLVSLLEDVTDYDKYAEHLEEIQSVHAEYGNIEVKMTKLFVEFEKLNK